MRSVNTPTLETNRLRLRRFTEADLEAIFAIYSDETVNTFLPRFPIKTMDGARQLYAKEYAEAYRLPSAYQYAICLKTCDIPIGYIAVSMEESHDMGYALRQEYWRQGIATEAGQALIARLKEDGLPYITATHDVKNPKSGAVMQRLGMQYQYSYQEQWQPKNIPVIFRMYQLNLDGRTDRVYKSYWDQSSVRFVENDVQSIQ